MRRTLIYGAVVLVIIVLAAAMGHLRRNGLAAPFDVTVPAVAHVELGEFRIEHRHRYNLFIGTDTERTSPQACLARTHAKVEPQRCTHVAPGIGATQWVLRQSGRIVTSGSSPEQTAEWAGTSVEQRTMWRRIGSFWAQPGDHYALEISVDPSLATVAAYHPRIMIGEPAK